MLRPAAEQRNLLPALRKESGIGLMPYMYRLISVSGWIWAVIVFAYILIRPAKVSGQSAQSIHNTDEKHR
jgi:hypothetical protein